MMRRQGIGLRKPRMNGETLPAEALGLRYTDDRRSGLARRRNGTGFVYLTAGGTRVRDGDTLTRIRALAIPPAWRDVWICADPNGHLQATGRDAKGRKQYRYHPRWREVRDGTKYDRMIAFARALPRIRRRAARDLAGPGLSRTKILATIVRLLEVTLIRVGNEEYAKHNGSFGLATMRDRHVRVNGAALRFEFRGKSGMFHKVDVHDRRLARIVRRSRDLPGFELFQYRDESGACRAVDAADVNAYLKSVAGERFTAKDFRTWAGTVLAVRALRGCAACASLAQAKRNVVKAVEQVAERLGNTKTVCRKCYIHPGVLDAYLDGTWRKALSRKVGGARRGPPGLSCEEEAVLALLHQGSTRDTRAARAA